mgnify:CR=1 FL=1
MPQSVPLKPTLQVHFLVSKSHAPWPLQAFGHTGVSHFNPPHPILHEHGDSTPANICLLLHLPWPLHILPDFAPGQTSISHAKPAKPGLQKQVPSWQ